jgi:hypothetical protein
MKLKDFNFMASINRESEYFAYDPFVPLKACPVRTAGALTIETIGSFGS